MALVQSSAKFTQGKGQGGGWNFHSALLGSVISVARRGHAHLWHQDVRGLAVLLGCSPMRCLGIQTIGATLIDAGEMENAKIEPSYKGGHPESNNGLDAGQALLIDRGFRGWHLFAWESSIAL